jgi:hypothetical protein
MHEEEEYRRISGFEQYFCEFVVDPLYGSIGLTPEEKRITDSAIFRRLKRIKQLGLVSEFYNGASHSRFDHSLGALHITWTMFKRFVDNLRTFDRWIPDNGILSFFPDDTIRALRISALIHDLGHGPFSHYFEGISERMGAHVDHDKISPFLIGDKEFQKRHFKRYYEAMSDDRRLKKMFLRAQVELLECLPNDAIFRKKILCIMKPQSTPVKDDKFVKVENFLHDLIYGDIGSDRIDYLLRDTHFTGLGHRFNLNDLLDNVAAIYDLEDNKVRLAIASEGEDVLDFFLTTRYYHYRLIANKMENIDQYTKLEARVENWIMPKKNKLAAFLNLTLGDELYFEKIVPPLNSWSFERIGSWTLGQIRTDYNRFLVYRLLTDSGAKLEYLNAIRQKLSDDASRNQSVALRPFDLQVECIVEKPRIPIIPVYRPKYFEIKTVPQKEKNWLSSLVHDDSEMVIGLARTYVAHTTIIIYSKTTYVNDLRDYTRKTLSFFVDTDLFRSVLDKLHEMSRLDVMFCSLYCICKSQGDPKTATAKGTPLSMTTLNKFFRIIKQMQNELSLKVYDFDKKEGYNAEEKKAYPYPSDIINDLIPCEYSGLVKISKDNRYINRWDKKAIPEYAMTYGLNFPTQADKNFDKIMACYPEHFKQKIEKACKEVFEKLVAPS